jgi:hypothetical protein
MTDQQHAGVSCRAERRRRAGGDQQLQLRTDAETLPGPAVASTQFPGADNPFHQG